MIRTDGTYQALKAMQTVKQVGGDFRDVVMEIQGMWDKNAGSLERLGGKLTTSIGTARVWSINQLRFRDSNAIVNRCGSTFLGVYDAPRYPAPAKFNLPPWNSPPIPPDPPAPDQNSPKFLPPNIIPPDQKQDDLAADKKIEKEPHKQGPYESMVQYASNPYDLILSPTTLTFDLDLGALMPLVQFADLEITDPLVGLPEMNLVVDGTMPPSMRLADAFAPNAGNTTVFYHFFGGSQNLGSVVAEVLGYPPSFVDGTNSYEIWLKVMDTYTGKPINNVSGYPLKSKLTIITHKTPSAPAVSMICTASNWTGITVGAIYLKSVNIDASRHPIC